jgi:hypothetical protein
MSAGPDGHVDEDENVDGTLTMSEVPALHRPRLHSLAATSISPFPFASSCPFPSGPVVPC